MSRHAIYINKETEMLLEALQQDPKFSNVSVSQLFSRGLILLANHNGYGVQPMKVIKL